MWIPPTFSVDIFLLRSFWPCIKRLTSHYGQFTRLFKEVDETKPHRKYLDSPLTARKALALSEEEGAVEGVMPNLNKAQS